MKIYNYKNIIWDWNGTLLDDARYVYDKILKELFKLSKVKPLTFDECLIKFKYPIRNYYETLGITVPYNEIVAIYIKLYNIRCTKLHWGVRSLLRDKLKKKNNFICSLRDSSNLTKETAHHVVTNYFKEIIGTSFDFNDKFQMLQYLCEKYHLSKKKTVVIGDTAYDAEVAKSYGMDCILIANGHQDKTTLLPLQGSKVVVVDKLVDLSR